MYESTFHILIVKIGAIGDVALCLPLLSKIINVHPNAHISWIAGQQAAPLLQATESIDQLIVLREKNLLEGSFFQKCFEVFKIWKKLAGRSFDLIIIAHADPRYRLLTLPVKGKKRSFPHKRPLPGRYHLFEYLRLLDPKQQGPLEERYVFPSFVLPENLTFKSPFVALYPGGASGEGGKALRRWPLQNYLSLAEKLISAEISVAVIGGKEDEDAKKAFNALNVQNFIGSLDLVETLYLLKNASLLVTHDGGPLHLAKSIGCPTLSLFGPTNPREFTDPKNPLEKVIWKGLALNCSPCYDGKHYSSCKNPLCMKSITPEEVFSYVKEQHRKD